jgi:Tol biopolymer transport system component
VTDRHDLDQLVTGWLHTGVPSEAPQVVLSTTLERVAGVGQERPFGGRRFDAWIARSPRLHWAIVLAVFATTLVAAVAGGAALLLRSSVPPTGVVNGWVAYAQHTEFGDERDTPMDMYVVREGREPLKIVGSDGGHLRRAVCPVFSPDGTRLAYAESTDTSGVTGNTYQWAARAVVILALDADGLPTGSAVRIPASPDGGDPCPEWSPDGRSLAFLTGGKAKLAILSGVLAVVQPGASISDVSASLEDLQIGDPALRELTWSGDGDAIAVAGPSGIWLAPVSGGTARQLATGTGIGLSWSPDGARIAFATDDQEPLVRILDVASGTTQDIGSGYGPVWAPDGSRIAYERVILPGAQVSEVVVADPDGSEPHVIALASLGSSAATTGTTSGVMWAPDGSRLLFVGCCSSTDRTQLISVSATGEPAPVVLATAPSGISDTGVSWQPVLR